MRNDRRRLELLPCNKWRRPAPRHITLPLPVILKRLTTDFLVLMPLGRRIRFVLLSGARKRSHAQDGFCFQAFGTNHFPRYFDGLRNRSSRSTSRSFRPTRRRRCLAAFGVDWGRNQACLTSWMMARQMSLSVFMGSCHRSVSAHSLSGALSTGDEVDEHHDYRNHQQEVN